MKRWHMVFDTDKCIGCFSCVLACKDEHVGNEWLPYTDRQQKRDQKWIELGYRERGWVPRVDLAYRPFMCGHCDDAPCAKRAPGCVIRREDGIVLLDPRKAHGNRELVDACPYGAISWNEEVGAAQKCTFCAHLIDDGWKEPRCVQACPLKALSFAYCEDSEWEKIAGGQGLEPLDDDGSQPRVLYKNLYRHKTCFIAGAIAYIGEAGEERAATEATVELRQAGELVTTAQTDFFGEYKIDRLPKGSGAYELTYLISGYDPRKKEITLGDESVCLDVEIFEKR